MRAPDRPLIKAPCGELPRRLGRRRLRLHADGDAAGAKVSRRSKKRSRIEPAGAGSRQRCRSVPPYAARCAATGASTRHRLRLDRSSNLRVAGSSPARRAIFTPSIPGTWFTDYSEDIVYTFLGTKGFGAGLTRPSSRSKKPRSKSRKLTSQIWSSTSRIPTSWPAKTLLRLTFRRPMQMRPQ
jgi:hypothetical protein